MASTERRKKDGKRRSTRAQQMRESVAERKANPSNPRKFSDKEDNRPVKSGRPGINA
jgi:hypothetical protein